MELFDLVDDHLTMNLAGTHSVRFGENAMHQLIFLEPISAGSVQAALHTLPVGDVLDAEAADDAA